MRILHGVFTCVSHGQFVRDQIDFLIDGQGDRLAFRREEIHAGDIEVHRLHFVAHRSEWEGVVALVEEWLEPFRMVVISVWVPDHLIDDFLRESRVGSFLEEVDFSQVGEIHRFNLEELQG